MHRQMLWVLIFLAPCAKSSEVNSYLATVEYGVEKFCYISNFAARFLEDFNDRHLGRSQWGSILGYEEIKPRISDGGSDRGLKKPMMLALLPLIFHVGAASTWMILTSVMAVKSVAIGLILLVFKIAVSSAKMGSFFTQLKSKNAEPHTYSEYSWSPHVIPTYSDWTSHTSDWNHEAYKSRPTYKENEVILEDAFYENSHKIAEKKNG